MYHAAKLTPETLTLNRKYLEQAIAFDPKFALAHNAIGSHFFVLACGTLQSAHEAIPLSRAAVQTALDIDPTLPDAQALLGAIAAVYDYNWEEAGRHFHLAMVRAPGSRCSCTVFFEKLYPTVLDGPLSRNRLIYRSLHTMQSISKSVASALVGIAIQRGEILGAETNVLPYFDV